MMSMQSSAAVTQPGTSQVSAFSAGSGDRILGVLIMNNAESEGYFHVNSNTRTAILVN